MRQRIISDAEIICRLEEQNRKLKEALRLWGCYADTCCDDITPAWRIASLFDQAVGEMRKIL